MAPQSPRGQGSPIMINTSHMLDADTQVLDGDRRETAFAVFDVHAVRRDFPILEQKVHDKPLVYLDNAATSQKPQVVVDALCRFYTEECANIHRGVHHLSERATREYEEGRV